MPIRQTSPTRNRESEPNIHWIGSEYLRELTSHSILLPISTSCCQSLRSGPTAHSKCSSIREGTVKFRPLQDRVLIRRIEEEEKTAGGIIIPDTAKEKPMEGEVI